MMNMTTTPIPTHVTCLIRASGDLDATMARLSVERKKAMISISTAALLMILRTLKYTHSMMIRPPKAKTICIT